MCKTESNILNTNDQEIDLLESERLIQQINSNTFNIDDHLTGLLERALDPEWQRIHHEMGFYSPIYNMMESLGLFNEDDAIDTDDMEEEHYG